MSQRTPWCWGPYGPGCGKPSWQCQKCREWTDDPGDACPACGYAGELRPPRPPIELKVVRYGFYSNEPVLNDPDAADLIEWLHAHPAEWARVRAGLEEADACLAGAGRDPTDPADPGFSAAALRLGGYVGDKEPDLEKRR